MRFLQRLRTTLFSRTTVLAVSTTLAITIATLFGLFEFIELKAVDAVFGLRGPVAPVAPIVIVAVDDESIRETQLQWPWPRSYMAQLVSKISEGKPKSITVDVFWYEPGPDLCCTEPLIQIIRAAPDVGAAQQAIKSVSGDAALAKAIAEAGNVILANDINRVEQSGFVLDEYRRPLPEFEEAAMFLGLANLKRDTADGFIRQMPIYLINPNDEQAYFAWSTLTALNYLGAPLPTSIKSNSVQLGNVTVPLDGRFYMNVNFRGGPGEAFEQVPAYQVVNSDIDPPFFKDKIVLIGATSVSLQDVYPVPFKGSSKPMPGVEVNANVIDTILSGQFINRWPVWLGALAVLVLGIVAYLFSISSRPLIGIVLTIGALIAYLVFWYVAFAQLRTEVYVVAPLVGLTLGFAVPSVERATTEALARRRVRGMFERFVSPEMVEQMVETGLEASRGQRTELTVLFSDIRGFTTMSEKMTPNEVVDMLNEYLGVMTDVILKHGGTIDKYEGDLIMAFFNAPIAQPDHPKRAVEAAIDMRITLDQLKAKWAKEGTRPTNFEMGIGLNTGDAFVGLIGSEKRINYTCIGDSVNLASRVQDLTKDLRWPLLITEFTYERIKDEFDAEFGEARMVKGKTVPVSMYKVIGRKGAPDSEKVRALFA
ncbi:MAG: adenylate/guanylate cyclase domain-containing protein [Chloroflexi bacterium]|nr:adenylate/guanylate cyclase domain-containing protein [Chloroflexota bacterium]